MRRVAGPRTARAPDPLHRLPLFTARKPDQLRDAMVNVFGARQFDAPQDSTRFRATANCLWLDRLDLGWMTCSGAYEYSAAPVGMVRQFFRIRGTAQLSGGAREFPIDAEATCVVPAGMEARFKFASGYTDFRLRLQETALRAKLGAMIGMSVAGKLEFEVPSSFRDPRLAQLRRLIDHMVAELDNGDTVTPVPILAQYEQSVLICFLTANRHNFSHLLERAPAAAAPWQVRRAEDHIEASAHAAVPIEVLAADAGVGALSLAAGFRRLRGVSLAAFRQQARLKLARRMLLASEETLSVADVASQLGFGNPARLAEAYRKAFGERSWEAIAKSRRHEF